VHDFGVTSRGDPFIAMELLAGEDLASLLERQQKVSPEAALQMLLPIAHGLAAAHDKGIVHRDIKPENIFLAREDDGEIRPKVLDFGIARMIDSPTKLTLEGMPLGTPEYMSPELARGDTAEATSDVWSFSVVLYELLTGELPFAADNYNALMQRILHCEPTPLTQRGDFDNDLEAIVMKGLRKHASERWNSMREMGRALARLLLHWGFSEDVAGTSLRRSWLANGESAPPEVSTVERAAGSASGEEASTSAQASERRHLVSERAAGAPEPTAAQCAAGLEPRTESACRPESAARPGVEVSQEPSTPGAVDGDVAPAVSNNWSSPDTDEFQLAAIAEMNRGGDPVEVLERAERRRTLWLVAAVIVLSFTLVGSILISTGVIGGV
jgi:serine/threonine protein kinase